MSSYINGLVEIVSMIYTKPFYFGIGKSLVSLQFSLRLLEKKATPIHTCAVMSSVPHLQLAALGIVLCGVYHTHSEGSTI